MSTPPVVSLQNPNITIQEYINKLIYDSSIQIQNYTNVYALMPTDNSTAIASGASIAFPRQGPVSGTGFVQVSPTQLTLPHIGTYEVTVNAVINVPAQLIATLNGAPVASTVTGKDISGSNLQGSFLITTLLPNSILTIQNASAGAITLVAAAGGTNPVSAQLIVKLLK